MNKTIFLKNKQEYQDYLNILLNNEEFKFIVMMIC